MLTERSHSLVYLVNLRLGNDRIRAELQRERPKTPKENSNVREQIVKIHLIWPLSLSIAQKRQSYQIWDRLVE